MANWLIAQDVDLQCGAPSPQVWPNALMLYGDNAAHTWRVRVMDGGVAAVLTGCTVSGYFVRGDGNTVMVQGTITGNVATVVLASQCYASEGELKGVLRLAKSGYTVTLSALIFRVRKDLTDSYVDPGEVIPSLAELLAQIDACEAATTAANTATTNANAAEVARVTAEQARVAAETARASAETARAAAEAARVAAENARVTAESGRATQEQQRAAAEAARVAAENARVAAEQARVDAETARVTAEQARVSAEAARVTAEQARVAAEHGRAALGLSVVDGALCYTWTE